MSTPKRTRPTAAKRGRAKRSPSKPATRTDAELRKARALPLVILGMPYAQIAAEVGCSASTIERWVHEDPRFRRAIEGATQASDEVVEGFRAELARGATAALQTLLTAAATDWQAAARLFSLIGLGATRKLEHSGPGGSPILLERVAEILAKKARRRGGPIAEREGLRRTRALIAETAARVQAGEVDADEALRSLAAELGPAEPPADDEAEE